MTARLFCKTGQLAGASFEIGKEATIGKNPGNTIQLYPALLSGKHARIFYDEKAQAYFLEDLNSRNGTKLDGMPVQGKERLGKLHIITFANTFDFFFQIVDATEAKPAVSKPAPAAEQKQPAKAKPAQAAQPVVQPSPPPAAPPAAEERLKTVFDDGAMAAPPVFEEQRAEQAAPSSTQDAARTKIGVEFSPVPSFVEPSKPPKDVAPPVVGGAFVLVFESLKGKPQAFELGEGSSVVGRDAACTIVVEDPSVSRRHAEFVLKDGRLTLKDLGSKNSTFIDEQRISKEVEVREGMQIAFGLVKARLVRKPTR
jgi:pSer/pThr/pTyr-binding forkhead associated (FHA) protein